jgi:hypothetical protein
MKQPDDPVWAEPALIPEGMFVIQLRSDSAVPRRRLRGRVEHVMSGQSAPFTSLANLLAFMARFADAPARLSPEDSAETPQLKDGSRGTTD